MNIIENIHKIIIDFDELKAILSKDRNLELCIFGASSAGEELLYKLKAMNIEVSCFSDNDKKKWNTEINGIKIMPPEDLIAMKNIYIIISSLFIREIYKQLFDMGLDKRICFIPEQFRKEEDSLKLDIKEEIDKTANVVKEKILLCSTDRLGDAASRMGVFQKYIEFYEKENVFFITTQKSTFELISVISDNVMLLDKSKYINDRNYAISFIDVINKIKITKAIFLSITSQILSENLINCMKFYCIDPPAKNYTLDSILEVYNYITKSNLSINDVKPDISKYFNDDKFKPRIDIPQNYVCFGMGASWEGRMYPAKKLAPILEYLIENNYKPVMLGNGEIDEQYCNELKQYFDSNLVVNYVNKLSVQESAYVISKAKLFVGIESGLWNISYALRKKSVVLYGGGDYGRFKHEDSNIRYICNVMKCFNCGWNCKYIYIKCICDINENEIIEQITRYIKL